MKGKATTVEYTIEGNARGPTLFFIHGWPDNASLWRKQVAELSGDFRCVLVTLPNYGEMSEKAGGFDFPELVERLAATVRQVQPQGRVNLVTHDWGAYLGYQLEQSCPELIESIAALDIGGHLHPISLKTRLMIMGYQWALIACWLVGGVLPPLGRLMTQGVGKVVSVPARQRAVLRSRYNYLYFYLWRAMLMPWQRHKLLAKYRPKCPVLFMFGARKPLMFHSPRWLQIVTESGGYALGVEGAGHWLMESHAGVVNENLLGWLQSKRVKDGG